jgi:hypothetical protein
MERHCARQRIDYRENAQDFAGLVRITSGTTGGAACGTACANAYVGKSPVPALGAGIFIPKYQETNA